MTATKLLHNRPFAHLVFVLAMALCILPALSLFALAENTDSVLDEFLESLVPPVAKPAIAQIVGDNRKLLAARSYVRARRYIKERWSWTADEIEAFQGSKAQNALLAEVDAVNEHFKQANPGFELYANTKVRSLDRQIEMWNSNKSVEQAAILIFEAFEAEFAEDGFKGVKLDADNIRQWLASYKPPKRPRIAAPGMTRHGRASAIDFQIMQDGKIIAGADGGSLEAAWKEAGWDEKLKASIAAAGPSFTGPLKNPDEPWHYDYAPRIGFSKKNEDGSLVVPVPVKRP